jgi:hypothetical protein
LVLRSNFNVLSREYAIGAKGRAWCLARQIDSV